LRESKELSLFKNSCHKSLYIYH